MAKLTTSDPLGARVLRIAARRTGSAALPHHLVDLQVNPLIDLRLLRVGLVRGESTSRDRLIDAGVRRVLERRRDIGTGFAVGRGDFGQRLAI